MAVTSVMWSAAAAAMAAAAPRLRDLPERAGLAGAGVMLLAVALGFVWPETALAAIGALGLAGWLPALAALLHGGRLRAEVWLTVSAGLGALALAVMARDLPLVFVAAPGFAQGASLSIGLVALGAEEASGRRA